MPTQRRKDCRGAPSDRLQRGRGLVDIYRTWSSGSLRFVPAGFLRSCVALVVVALLPSFPHDPLGGRTPPATSRDASLGGARTRSCGPLRLRDAPGCCPSAGPADLAATFLAWWALSPRFSPLAGMRVSFLAPLLVLAIVVAGAGLGALGSAFSIRRYLKV